VVATAATEFDVTGYETHIPDADEVESVTLGHVISLPYDSGNRIDITTSDGSLIRRLRALHACTWRTKRPLSRH
jgi:hypothetical protein